MSARTILKAALAANLASAIRFVRFGPVDAVRRLEQAFQVVDPLEGIVSNDTTRDFQQLRVVELADLMDRIPTVTVDAAHVNRDGALPLSQLVQLLALAVDCQPGVILEIGTYFGTTTKALALAIPSATVHTVDLPLDWVPSHSKAGLVPDEHEFIASRKVGVAFENGPPNIVQHLVDTGSWSFAPAAGATLIFIDGSHTYEFVKNDTLRALAICGKPATIVWHDCDPGHTGVVRWLADMVRQGYDVVRLKDMPLAVLKHR
jgi:hypothetical protein